MLLVGATLLLDRVGAHGSGLHVDGLEVGGTDRVVLRPGGQGGLLAHNPVDFCIENNALCYDFSKVESDVKK